MRPRSALQPWVMELTIMQQSVLMSALRGPDTLPKNHTAKLLLRWYRRCVLISAFDGQPIMNPYYEHGGSFTGPSLLFQWNPRPDGHGMLPPRPNKPGPADTIHGWEDEMNILVRQYLASCDEVPHHFHLHFLHGSEILGFKHPNIPIRNWWYSTYHAMANDMHLRPELMEQMDKRLGDREKDWRAAEEVTAAGPPPRPSDREPVA